MENGLERRETGETGVQGLEPLGYLLSWCTKPRRQPLSNSDWPDSLNIYEPFESSLLLLGKYPIEKLKM